MKCKHARQLVALHAGGDGDALEAREAERHLAVCPSCAEYCHELESGLGVLQSVGAAAPSQDDESLWPKLQSRLTITRAPRRTERFNGVVAAFSVAASILAVAILYHDIGNDGGELSYVPTLPAQPVNRAVLEQDEPILLPEEVAGEELDRLYPSQPAAVTRDFELPESTPSDTNSAE